MTKLTNNPKNMDPNQQPEQSFKLTKKHILTGVTLLIAILLISSLGWWEENPWHKLTNLFKQNETQEEKYKIVTEEDQQWYDKLQQAEEELNDYPDNFTPRIDLARAVAYFKDYDRAVKLYQEANTISPKNDLAWNNLGNVYFEMGKYAMAENCFLRVIENKPTHIDAYVTLSYLYRNELKDQNRAANILMQGIEANPNDASLVSNLAQYYYKQKNYQEAVKWYEELVRINPSQAARDELAKAKSMLNNR